MVVADLVINHMSGRGRSGTGTGGSGFNGDSQDYPGVPFSSLDFHQPYCEIQNYQNVDEAKISFHFSIMAMVDIQKVRLQITNNK